MIRIKFKAINQKYVEMVSVFTNRLFCLFRLFYTALTLEVFIREDYVSIMDFMFKSFSFSLSFTESQSHRIIYVGRVEGTSSGY